MLPSRQKQRFLRAILQSDAYEYLVRLVYVDLDTKAYNLYHAKHGAPPTPEYRRKFYEVLMPKARVAAEDIVTQLFGNIELGNNGWYLIKKFAPIFALASASSFCAIKLAWYLYKRGDQFSLLSIDPYACFVAIFLPWCFVIAALIAEIKSE